MYFPPEFFQKIFSNKNDYFDFSKSNLFSLALIALEFLIGCSIQEVYDLKNFTFDHENIDEFGHPIYTAGQTKEQNKGRRDEPPPNLEDMMYTEVKFMNEYKNNQNH